MLKVCLQTALNSTLDEIPAASEAAFSNNQQEVYADDLLCFRRTMRTYFFWCEPRAPWHFLAKVLKYTYDGGDDQLAWLRELDKRPNYYEFQAATDVCLKNNQRSYRSYQHPLGLYEFRTPKSSGLYTCPETMHPLNCKSCHIFTRTITKWQSDQVFHSLWMSWIEEQSNDWQTNIYEKHNETLLIMTRLAHALLSETIKHALKSLCVPISLVQMETARTAQSWTFFFSF